LPRKSLFAVYEYLKLWIMRIGSGALKWNCVFKHYSWSPRTIFRLPVIRIFIVCSVIVKYLSLIGPSYDAIMCRTGISVEGVTSDSSLDSGHWTLCVTIYILYVVNFASTFALACVSLQCIMFEYNLVNSMTLQHKWIFIYLFIQYSEKFRLLDSHQQVCSNGRILTVSERLFVQPKNYRLPVIKHARYKLAIPV
jgi:hypothetical protein